MRGPGRGSTPSPMPSAAPFCSPNRSLSAHSRASGNPEQRAPEFATLGPRFRGDERRRGELAAMLARNDAVPPASERRIEASLHFATGGGRTVLVHQHVPYPFHVTRAFHLDRARPDLATLYLQSASGGLYRGDRLMLDIDVAPGAAAH